MVCFKTVSSTVLRENNKMSWFQSQPICPPHKIKRSTNDGNNEYVTYQGFLIKFRFGSESCCCSITYLVVPDLQHTKLVRSPASVLLVVGCWLLVIVVVVVVGVVDVVVVIRCCDCCCDCCCGCG
jgi:hypothetical protein